MFVKNLKACLITINVPSTVVYDKTDKNGKPKEDAKVMDVQRKKKYDILPAGPAVEIEAEHLKIAAVKKQVEHYIKNGDLVKTEAPESVDESEKDGSDFSGLDRVELVAAAEAYGIDVTESMTDADIVKALQKAG